MYDSEHDPLKSLVSPRTKSGRCTVDPVVFYCIEFDVQVFELDEENRCRVRTKSHTGR